MCAVRLSSSSIRVDPRRGTQTIEPARPTGRIGRFVKAVLVTLVTATLAVLLVAAVIAGVATRERWLPWVQTAISGLLAASAPVEASDHAAHAREEPTPTIPGHSGNDTGDVLELSDQAQKNIGLVSHAVELGSFDRTISVPATVVDRAGRTEIEVSAPMTGAVSRIFPIQGQAVRPGDPLFEIRLTHEDLVKAQREFLQTSEEIEILKREVDRLERVTRDGAIAGKRLLEQQYALRKVEAAHRAQRQALVLHGLSESHLDTIIRDGELLQRMTIHAPAPASASPEGLSDIWLQVARLEARQGQFVSHGAPLCVLSNRSELYIEGKAFEQDAKALNEAAELGRSITAVFDGGPAPHSVSDLRVLYVENAVERDSRALRFYVRLPNELVRNETTAEGDQFIAWRYKPGQRVELLVPVERWERCVVLPVEAVIREGVETYIYVEHGGHFDRRTVHVEFRDGHHAVLENDGTLFPGDMVAVNGAFELHLALKNKSGKGLDPHAGHSH